MKRRQPKSNGKEKRRPSWSIRHWLGYGLFGAVVIHFLYVASKKTIQNFQLADRGVLAKAYVTKKKSVGGKGTIEFTLKYKVNGMTYLNELANESWTVGDSVDIVLLQEDPMVIRSFRFVSENYTTSLKLNE